MPKGPISKTQRKKQVRELQDLGEELVELSDDQLATIELPEMLRDAVMEARSITQFEARRRQLQYIGKIMRRVDPGPIRAALNAWRTQSHRRAALHRRAEAWRERLISDPDAFDALRIEYPGVDAAELRTLIVAALRELEDDRPPRAFRQLYQALRRLIGEGVDGER